jgi:hypothetical protein
MAGGAQHTLQIMESSTEFDLNASLRKWSEDLAAQPGLTPEARAELETHLQETVKELGQRGLNEEESFWLACRRVGRPRQLGEEFAKAHPSQIWKRWALWVATAMLAMRILQGAFAGVNGALTFLELHAGQIPWWVEGVRDAFWDTGVGDVIGALVVVCGTILVARSPAGVSSRLWRLFFKSKQRFLVVGALSVVVIFGLERWSEIVDRSWHIAHMDYEWVNFSGASPNSFFKLMFPSTLVILIVWLLPSDGGTKTEVETGVRAG